MSANSERAARRREQLLCAHPAELRGDLSHVYGHEVQGCHECGLIVSAPAPENGSVRNLAERDSQIKGMKVPYPFDLSGMHDLHDFLGRHFIARFVTKSSRLYIRYADSPQGIPFAAFNAAELRRPDKRPWLIGHTDRVLRLVTAEDFKRYYVDLDCNN